MCSLLESDDRSISSLTTVPVSNKTYCKGSPDMAAHNVPFEPNTEKDMSDHTGFHTASRNGTQLSEANRQVFDQPPLPSPNGVATEVVVVNNNNNSTDAGSVSSLSERTGGGGREEQLDEDLQAKMQEIRAEQRKRNIRKHYLARMREGDEHEGAKKKARRKDSDDDEEGDGGGEHHHSSTGALSSSKPSAAAAAAARAAVK